MLGVTLITQTTVSFYQLNLIPCSGTESWKCSFCCAVVSLGAGKFFTARYSSLILHWIFNLSLSENESKVALNQVSNDSGLDLAIVNLAFVNGIDWRISLVIISFH